MWKKSGPLCDLFTRINMISFSKSMAMPCIKNAFSCHIIVCDGPDNATAFKKEQTNEQERERNELLNGQRARIKNDPIWNGDTFQLKIVIKWLYLWSLFSHSLTLWWWCVILPVLRPLSLLWWEFNWNVVTLNDINDKIS